MLRVRALFGRRRRLFSLLGLVLVLLACLASHWSTLEVLPDPNGFDDLVQAAGLIQGPWPNKGDWASADLAELRTFVDSNRTALDRARVGISRPGMAHFADTEPGLGEHLDQSGQIRNISRLLAGQARLALDEGRTLDAARINLDVIEVGQTLSQGSAFAGATAGWVIQDQAIGRLRLLRDQIAPTAQRDLIARLAELDAQRVAVATVKAREDRLFAGVTPLYLRVQFQLSGQRAAAFAPVHRSSQQIHDRVERNWRYLMVEWSIHLYHATTGHWPRSVGELVPSILPAVPIDPNTKQPLVYPANDAGELTDDLSQISATPTASTPP